MFKNLNQPLNITLTIIVGIAIAWVLALIIDLLFVGFFSSILKKHAKGMTVVVNAKYENIKKIYSLFEKYEVSVEERILDALKNIDVEALSKHDTLEGENVRNVLSYLKDEANFIANKNKEVLEKQTAKQKAKEDVEEKKEATNSLSSLTQAEILEYFMQCQHDNPGITLKEFIEMVESGKIVIGKEKKQ